MTAIELRQLAGDMDATDLRARRCGHNFLPAECPYGRCGYREALERVAELETQSTATATATAKLQSDLKKAHQRLDAATTMLARMVATSPELAAVMRPPEAR
jgi:hypothetical protein